MGIRRKEGVLLRGVKPELNLALQIAASYYDRKGIGDMFVTSLLDGVHSRGSLHYVGYAADLRIWNIDEVESFTEGLAEELGPEFDVVLESDHIHLEFKPKEI